MDQQIKKRSIDSMKSLQKCQDAVYMDINKLLGSFRVVEILRCKLSFSLHASVSMPLFTSDQGVTYISSIPFCLKKRISF